MISLLDILLLLSLLTTCYLGWLSDKTEDSRKIVTYTTISGTLTIFLLLLVLNII